MLSNVSVIYHQSGLTVGVYVEVEEGFGSGHIGTGDGTCTVNVGGRKADNCIKGQRHISDHVGKSNVILELGNQTEVQGCIGVGNEESTYEVIAVAGKVRVRIGIVGEVVLCDKSLVAAGSNFISSQSFRVHAEAVNMTLEVLVVAGSVVTTNSNQLGKSASYISIGNFDSLLSFAVDVAGNSLFCRIHGNGNTYGFCVGTDVNFREVEVEHSNVRVVDHQTGLTVGVYVEVEEGFGSGHIGTGDGTCAISVGGGKADNRIKGQGHISDHVGKGDVVLKLGNQTEICGSVCSRHTGCADHGHSKTIAIRTRRETNLFVMFVLLYGIILILCVRKFFLAGKL